MPRDCWTYPLLALNSRHTLWCRARLVLACVHEQTCLLVPREMSSSLIAVAGPDAAEACSATHVLAVKGNHDSAAPFPPAITDLHLHVVTLPEDLRIGGFNGCWRYKPRGHFLYDQDEAAMLIRQLPPVDILVTHNSPRGVHEADDHVHQGFVALSDYIQQHSPGLLIHGHQHTNRETMVGGTRIVGVYRSAVIEA